MGKVDYLLLSENFPITPEPLFFSQSCSLSWYRAVSDYYHTDRITATDGFLILLIKR